MSGKASAHASLPGPGNEADRVDVDLHGWLCRLRQAKVQRIGPFELLPLVGQETGRRRLLTVDEAIKTGVLEIGELGMGVVGEVEAVNTGRAPVLVLEGETLVGANQNRVVAHSVVVPAGGRVHIPVGCIERGRWGRGEGAFAPGASRMESSVRRDTVREKTAARRGGGRPTLNQRRLWREVAVSLDRAGVQSTTTDYHRLIQKRESHLRKIIDHFEPVSDQVGLVFLHSGRLLGIEIVGHPEIWKAVAGKTIGSFVAGVRSRLAERAEGHVPRGPGAWADALGCVRIETRPALGAGTDLEVSGCGLIGAGLWHGEGLAHLAVFPDA